MHESSLDALVAAPLHHTRLLENDRVRVLDTRIRPGETVPLHTHDWPAALYVIGFSHFLRRDAQGAVTLDSRTLTSPPEPGQALWSGALEAHTLENIGTSLLHIIAVELKLWAAAGAVVDPAPGSATPATGR